LQLDRHQGKFVVYCNGAKLGTVPTRQTELLHELEAQGVKVVLTNILFVPGLGSSQAFELFTDEEDCPENIGVVACFILKENRTKRLPERSLDLEQ
jgi:hypothetical protein